MRRKRLGPKKKIAFVCSGGGVKAGAFHLGVALALREQGFRFFGGTVSNAKSRTPQKMEISTYVGSSAGSIISCLLASGYSLENIFNSFLSKKPTSPEDTYPKVLPKLTYRTLFKLRPELANEQVKQVFQLKTMLKQILARDWESLIEFKWFKTSGFFSTKGLEQFMREEVLLNNSFQDFLPDLFIVATQLNHSRKMVFGKYHYHPPPDDPSCVYVNDVSVSDACAASAALPFIYSPYTIDLKTFGKTQFVDGEIRDTLSTHVAKDAGADLIFASYTHQPFHQKHSNDTLSDVGLPAILVQSIYLVIEQKINSSIYAKQSAEDAIQAVSEYCSQQGIEEQHQRRIQEILESKLGHRSHVDQIYIHPKSSDREMFFQDHFSLTPEKMSELVRSGFRAATDVLRAYDFEDLEEPHVSSKTQAERPSVNAN